MKTPKKTAGRSRRYSSGLLALASIAATTGLLAQTAPTAPAATDPAVAPADDEIIELTPFEVSSSTDKGYVATDTLAGTRIRSELRDLGSAISVVTKDFMNDIGATDAGSLLQYTANAEVGGSKGIFSGMNGTSDEGASLVNTTTKQRVRGLAAADNTRDYFVSDIPWDSYNVDRIDILRGPNSFLFGLGSPAGIQNASLQDAGFKTQGKTELRFGSYGSVRASLNMNQVLLKDQLSLRVAGLVDREKFRQTPAYENDKRVYAALRYEPKLIKAPGFKTSIKLKYEAGDISANRQREMTPVDNITAWYRPVDNTSATGGMGKLIIANPYYPSRTDMPAGGPAGGQAVSGNANYNPWLGTKSNAQQPNWSLDGDTGELYSVKGGWINAGAIGSNGVATGSSNGVYNKYFSGTLYGVNNIGTRANTPGYLLPLAQYGGYKSQSLTDPTVFDFFNTLIDGPNKHEFQKWTAYNIDLSQMAWDGRVALNLSYDRQQNKQGGESLLGWAPAIELDINQKLEDYFDTKSDNPNVGRPYVIGAGNSGTGNWTRTDRKTMRASLLGELRASDLTSNKFLVKLLGKHKLNGVMSNDEYFWENRRWQMYANNQYWAGYWNGNNGLTSTFNDRPPQAIIYLGDSVAGRSTASGANIPGIASKIELMDSGIRVFDPRPTVTTSIFGDPWTLPSNLEGVFNPTNLTQAANPANMIGWTNWTGDQLMRANGGDNLDLLLGADKGIKVTNSYAGSYQGFLWNDAFVPTLGWRYDSIKTKGKIAQANTSNRNLLKMDEVNYAMPDTYPDTALVKDHSVSGGLVIHLNRILKKDLLPINVSLTYAKSNNFQVTSIRRDLYGNTLGNPSGSTKEYGVLLSTKDNKYSLRVIKYETSMKGVNTSLGGTSIGSIISNGLNWRNVFLYQLGGYDYPSRGTDSYRNQWTNAYPGFIQYKDAAGATQTYAAGTPERIAGDTAALKEMNAAISGWNEIQTYLEGKGFFKAWNFTPTGPATALVDRATYLTDPVKYAPETGTGKNTVSNYGATAPQGFTVTSDTVSKGYEFEATANPTRNWRISFNAAKTDASRTNVGGESLSEWAAYMKSKLLNADDSLTPAGKVPRWGGAANSIGGSIFAPWYAQYTKLKMQEGTSADEVRPWRFNIVTNYSFEDGFLKGSGVGAAYRWQDKVVIGYPVGTDGLYDLSKPYYGPKEDSFDFWLSYERKLTKKVNWKIQLNVRNLFASNSVIPVFIQPDGQSWATVRVAPNREWSISNTFSF